MNNLLKLFCVLLFIPSALFAKANVASSLDELYAFLEASIIFDGEDKTIMILPFTATDDSLTAEGKMIAEYGVNYFLGTPGIQIVDRENMQNMMAELSFSNSGMVDQNAVLELGQMASASYMITGTVQQNQHMRTVSAKMIEVESSTIVGAAYAKFRSEEANDFYAISLGEQLKPSSAAFRSLALPGWGQFYTGHPGQGTLFATLCAGGVGASIWSAIDYANKAEVVDTYEEQGVAPIVGEDPIVYNARKDQIISKAEDEMNDAGSRTNMIIIGTASVWAINVIDALILGKIESNKIEDAYFTALPADNGQLALAAGITLNF